jgi:hypothetical protein
MISLFFERDCGGSLIARHFAPVKYQVKRARLEKLPV